MNNSPDSVNNTNITNNEIVEIKKKALPMLKMKQERTIEDFSKEDEKESKKRVIDLVKDEIPNSAESEKNQDLIVQVISLEKSEEKDNHILTDTVFQQTSDIINKNIIPIQEQVEKSVININVDDNLDILHTQKEIADNAEMKNIPHIESLINNDLPIESQDTSLTQIIPDKSNIIMNLIPIENDNSTQQNNNSSELGKNVIENSKIDSEIPNPINVVADQTAANNVEVQSLIRHEEVQPTTDASNVLNKEDNQLNAKINVPVVPKKISFNAAKKEIDEFAVQIEKIENEINSKYGLKISEHYYSEILPDELKMKLIEEFFSRPDIIEFAHKSANK